MPAPNLKNLALLTASSTLGFGVGLGDQLQQQTEDQNDELRKKKKLQLQGLPGDMNLGASTMLGLGQSGT